MKKSDSPCAPDCPNRNADCHGSCEKYLEFYNSKREKDGEKTKHYPLVEYRKDYQAKYLRSQKKKKPRHY